MLKEFLKNYQSEQINRKNILKKRQDELNIRIRETAQFILYLEKEDENDFEPFTPRAIYPHHKERISDLKLEQENLQNEEMRIKSELKDVNCRLAQISDIMKIVEQNESTDRILIERSTYNVIISELNQSIQSIDKCMKSMDNKKKSNSNMQYRNEMKSVLDNLDNILSLLSNIN